MSTRSNGGPEPQDLAAAREWERLDGAIRRLLEEHQAVRERLEASQRRVRDLESALNAVSTGNLDPIALSEQVLTYERDQRALVKRLTQARAAVERIQSRLQFLEDER